MTRRYWLELGIIILITNAMCMHLFYSDSKYQSELYFTTEVVGRLLIVLGIPFRNKLINLAITTEIARLLYNIGWCFGINQNIVKGHEWFVPLVMIATFYYLNGTTRK